MNLITTRHVNAADNRYIDTHKHERHKVMMYVTKDFGQHGKIVVRLNDGGQEPAHVSDEVIVIVDMDFFDFKLDFGCRYFIPSPSSDREWPISTFMAWHSKQSFTGVTYKAAREKAAVWLRQVLVIIESAVIKRNVALLEAGEPPAAD